jgi:hypothetical protein
MIARAYIGAPAERQAIPINLVERCLGRAEGSLRNYNNFTEVNPV